MRPESLLKRAGHLCRAVASALIAGVWRSRSVKDVYAQLSARSTQEQVTIIGGVLVVLLLLSLFAAQFGWLGLLAFWFLLIVIVN
ncbi:MAG: hypothetical protein AAGH83_01790 [Pseudomonadota bacterium]